MTMSSERPFLQRAGISPAQTAAGIWHQLPLVVGARAAGIAPSLLATSSAVPQLPRQAVLKGPQRQPGSKEETVQVSLAKSVPGTAGTCAIVDARGVPH